MSAASSLTPVSIAPTLSTRCARNFAMSKTLVYVFSPLPDISETTDIS